MGREPCFLASPFSVRSIILRIGLIVLLFVLLSKVRQVAFQKTWENNAVMNTKDSNCVGILSDKGEAATASNLSEYTISPDVSDRLTG